MRWVPKRKQELPSALRKSPIYYQMWRGGWRWQITFCSLGTLVGDGTDVPTEGDTGGEGLGEVSEDMSSVWDMLILRFLWDI